MSTVAAIEAEPATRPSIDLRVEWVPPPALRSVWDRVLPRARTQNSFVTWEFLGTWWSHFRRERTAKTAVVWDGDDPIAIVPLYVEELALRFGRARVLRNVGFGDVVNPDFLDAIVVEGREEEVADALAPKLLADTSWDYADFQELAPEGSLIRIAERIVEKNKGMQLRVEKSRVCPYVTLPATFDEYLKSCSSHFRYRVRNAVRKLEKNLDVQWRRVGDDLDVPGGMAHLTQLHQERMESSERRGNFIQPDYRAFLTQAAYRLHLRGDLYFWVAFGGGSPIAANFGFTHAGTYYGYQMGFAKRFQRWSPGTFMTAVTMKRLIEGGATEFNMLRGKDSWKFRWTEDIRHTYTAVMLRPGMRSRSAELRTNLSQSRGLIVRWLMGRERFDQMRDERKRRQELKKRAKKQKQAKRAKAAAKDDAPKS